MRQTSPTLLLPAVLPAVLAAALAWPGAARGDAAACSVTATSVGEMIVNPATGEDADFFVNSGGVPNIMFLLDTSGSMVRLPPDGAAMGWGSFEKTGINAAGAGYGCWNVHANTRAFHSACGTLGTWESREFHDGPAAGWAYATDAAGRYCPYMTTGNKDPKTDKPGFDPDFFATFFPADRVYRDALGFGAVTGDGWDDLATNPAKNATGTAYTVDGFCGQFASALDLNAKRNECLRCLKGDPLQPLKPAEGYFFDGSYLPPPSWDDDRFACTTTDECQARGYGTCVNRNTGIEHKNPNEKGVCRVPNVWFSGNFLNFHPPKFIVARKVLKDVLVTVRKVRLGIATFNGNNGAKIFEPVGPVCDKIDTPSSWDSSRGSILNAINNASGKGAIRFDGATPLAEALLDIGQYFHKKEEPWFGAAYRDAAFDEGNSAGHKSVCWSCQATAVVIVSDGAPTSDAILPPGGTDGTGLAGKVGSGVTGITDTQCKTCNTAQEAPDAGVAGICSGQQLTGACDAAGNPIKSYLPSVAWYLKNMDLRPDTETGADGPKMTGKQTITTYTIGLGLGKASNGAKLLQHAAAAAEGLHNGKDPTSGDPGDVMDAAALREAIRATMEDVNTRSISFGAASLSTLQASATQSVLIPRFEPSRAALWDGHLYAFDLFSEFSGGCYVPTSGPSGPANGDYDCDGFCTSVFLKDADGAFIQEDGTGAFKKNANPARAACGFGTMCTKAGGTCSDAGTTVAKPKWDVGERLASVILDAAGKETANPDHKKWSDRKVYTVIDSNGDRKFTSADTVLELAGEITDEVAKALVPYLNIQDPNDQICNGIKEQLANAGNPYAATIQADLNSAKTGKDKYASCAKAILQFAKGADVLNEKQAAAFPASLATRKYQLGDVFHSSPVEVWPPLPSDGWVCSAGLHPQCLSSIYETGVPAPATVAGNANAYDDWAKSARYKHRDKFTLVGANDGMLHAFTSGVWRAGENDTRTTPDESKFPYEGFHEDRASAGPTYQAKLGEEIWAFIPPDQLPKLRHLMGRTHQFFVDATPMVRDVWLDGVPNGFGGAASKNDKREKNEFHTVAVVGERRGGTKYFALDVTDASGDLGGAPKFLWLYPQPDDPESLSFGETYAEFVPKPPPIGPVRIERTCDAPGADGSTVLQRFKRADGTTVCFEERWIVMLSGGFDPLMTRGRGVHMVDVGTGRELWDFSQPAGNAGTCTEDSDPRCKLNYPVAATVGMMMWGTQSTFPETSVASGNNRYFDTATFGDTGGQLWALRFSDPGKLDANGKVTNWMGARIFQHSKSTAAAGCGLNYCYGQPFFYITSNLPIAGSKKFRVLAGTGDRFNLLDPVGGTCGPDNIRACVMKGCTVKLEESAGVPGARYAVTPLLGEQSYRMDLPASCSGLVPSTYASGLTAPAGNSCTAAKMQTRVTITCPSSETCSGAAESTGRNLSMTCTPTSDGTSLGACVPTGTNDPGLAIDLKMNNDVRNWFFSILVFEDVGARALFTTPAEAIAYDKARISEADLVDVNAYDADVANGGSLTAPLASASGKGWKYYFDHGAPNAASTTTIGGATWKIFRTDERTASVSTVEAGCTFWNTMQTGLSPDAVAPTTDCPVKGRCKAGRSQVSYLYGANPGTGAPCMRIDGGIERVQKNETLVPPHIGKLVAYVNSGQVSFGLTTVRIPQGGANVALGEVQDITSLVGWIPIDGELHACRHEDKAGAGPDEAVCK